MVYQAYRFTLTHSLGLIALFMFDLLVIVLIWQPLLDWARYRTPIQSLYLCRSGTHPSTSLTGASSANATGETEGSEIGTLVPVAVAAVLGVYSSTAITH